MNTTPPATTIPKLSCDFNEQGLSGEPDDTCYYGLCREDLKTLLPKEGMRVFIWDWSDSELVIGCEALLEHWVVEPYGDLWKARPIEGTWFEGRPDESFTHAA